MLTIGSFVCYWLLASTSSSFLVAASPIPSESVGGQQPRDAALDNYVRLVINNFFAALDEGIPALGIPVMDPLTIGNLTIPTLIVKGGYVNAAVANTAVHYLSSLTVTSLHIDIDAFRMDLRAFMPYMKIDGLYNLEGIALAVFPLYGDGPYRVEIFEVNMLGGGSMGLDETGNYLQLTSLEMDLDFITMVVYFENLLGGGDLGDTINDIISSLGIAIFDMVKPIVIENLTQGIMKVVNDALSHYPIGNLTTADELDNWKSSILFDLSSSMNADPSSN